MHVAVMGFRDQVSPRLDCSLYVVLATIEHGSVLSASAADVHRLRDSDFLDFFRIHHVDTVVCGGIAPVERQGLEELQIRVIGGVVGPVSAALFALAEGRLTSGQVLSGPGDDKHHEDSTGGSGDSEPHSCSGKVL